jgi:antitoxin VapB
VPVVITIDHQFTIEDAVPVQIANPQVVAKIERLSRAIGVGKTAAVEAAVDRMLADVEAAQNAGDPWNGIDAILAQLRRIPVRPDAFDAIEYDENGLPK